MSSPLHQIVAMMSTVVLCSICVLAAASTFASSTSRGQHYNIHQSHVFHAEPRAVVNIITNVMSNAVANSGSRILDVDASSSQLTDDAVISLLKGILNTHRDDNNDDTALNLNLEMNRITPVGIASVFDLLVGTSNAVIPEDGTKNITSDYNKTTIDNFVESMTNETSCVEGSNVVTKSTISSEKIDYAMKDDKDYKSELKAIASRSPHKEGSLPLSLHIEKLDLSFNDFGGDGTNPPSAQLLYSARRLFENEDYSILPTILLMENCGLGAAFCRSIGRGILNAYERNRIHSNTTGRLYRPSILRIGGNPAIGDAGAVALAAAFRMATSDDNTNGGGMMIEELDLSSCNIGDVGAEAIALALACNPSSLKRLDLSNNKVTNVGATALGRALLESSERTSGHSLEQIILDNNVGISDDGAAALAKALSFGAIGSVHLRSCSLGAEGISSFGKALVDIAKKFRTRQFPSPLIDIDISGNHFGISKPKHKKGAKYSASLLRDKASSNIKFIGESLRSRLKGTSFAMGLTTAESDDDEEETGNVGEIFSDDGDVEELDSEKLKTIARCGARAFSGEILKQSCADATQTTSLRISIGMRQCFLDNGAIDALAAAMIFARKAGASMSVDVAMNEGIDDATIAALKGDKKEELLLMSSAERHTDEVKRITDAEKRRKAAAKVAAARVRDTFLDEDFSDCED